MTPSALHGTSELFSGHRFSVADLMRVSACVLVGAAADSPTANNDGGTVSEDGPAATIELTGNDTDPDSGDDLEVIALDLTGTKGNVIIAADGEGVVYDPDGKFESLAAGEFAVDTFTYTVSDGQGGTDTATVTVKITGDNDGPAANNDRDTVAEDGPEKTIDLTGNDSDPDVSDDLEVTALDLTATQGKVTISADGDGVIYDPNGRFDFLADGETATDTFVYTVSDGHGGTDTATVTPLRARSIANCRPMPELAPVMHTVRHGKDCVITCPSTTATSVR